MMKTKIYILFIFLVFDLCDGEHRKKEMYMSAPKLIASNGYPVERHRVTTEDGYSLQLHRIPAGRRSARRVGDLNAKGKKAVLVCHGLLGSSGDFIIMGPDKSLGYLLADAGYDVWLGNLRGNIYTTHESYPKNDTRFWEFSFHEHGKYDVPAMIDKVLNVTGLQKIMYVGYSMGTTTFFAMASMRPDYNDKIVSFVALAPAVYLNNIRPLATFCLKTVDVPAIMQSRGFMSASMRPEFLSYISKNLCNFRNPEEDVCTTFMSSIVGEDIEQTDPVVQQTIVVRMQPASWRQLEHFGKVSMTGVFTSWENGLWGTVKPYNLSNVRVPVTLMYGYNDILTDKVQVMRLADTLRKNNILEETMTPPWPKFNHLDFTFAKDVGKLVNKPLIKHINKLYNKYGTS